MGTHTRGRKFARLDDKCRVCGLGFTQVEWDNRHSTPEGEDVHDRCCEWCPPVDPGLVR